MKINLLPKEERPLKNTAVRPEFIVSLIALVLLGGVLLGTFRENSRIADLALVIERAQAREEGLQTKVREVASLRQELNSLEVSQENYKELLVADRQALGALPILLEHSLPGLWIESLDWNHVGFELRGYTEDMTSVSKYLNYLNEHSDEAILNFAYPIDGTNFIVFGVEAKGVGGHGSASLY